MRYPPSGPTKKSRKSETPAARASQEKEERSRAGDIENSENRLDSPGSSEWRNNEYTHSVYSTSSATAPEALKPRDQNQNIDKISRSESSKKVGPLATDSAFKFTSERPQPGQYLTSPSSRFVEWQFPSLLLRKRWARAMGLEGPGSNPTEAGRDRLIHESAIPIKNVINKGLRDCLFRSFSFYLTGHENSHLRIRELIVDQLSLYGSESQNGFDVGGDSLEQMRKQGTWGTGREISAFATLLNINVYIFSLPDLQVDDLPKRWLWLLIEPSPDLLFPLDPELPRGSIYLEHISRSHYEAVLAVEP